MVAIGLGLAAAGLAVAPAIASPPNGSPGNGAQHSGLSPTSGGSNNCQQGGGSNTNGWAMLNKTGSPANTGPTIMQGEVHLIGAPSGATYTIQLAGGPSNNSCMPVGSLTTNGAGIGNGHIPSMPDMSQVTGGSGTYYVVLTDSNSNEQYASGPMTVS